MGEHQHQWRDTEAGCEDCGDHPAIACDGEGECPVLKALDPDYYEGYHVDLVYHNDPREAKR